MFLCHPASPLVTCSPWSWSEVKLLPSPSFLVHRRRMWALLQLHSKQCNQADCPVPRCKELRMLKRRQLIRQEEKRRQGYANMLQAQVGQQIFSWQIITQPLEFTQRRQRHVDVVWECEWGCEKGH